MPAEGGLVGEGAAAEATHVGLLSGVDALVPLEGVELGELLVAVLTAVGALACNTEGSCFWEPQMQTVSKEIIKMQLPMIYLCVFSGADGGSSSGRSSGRTAHTCTVWSRCGCWSGASGTL